MLQKRFIHWLLLAGGLFIIFAPTLTWLEFSGGMENFNVETAQETVRNGNWLIPTMGLKPRIEKPPLVQWITSLGMMSSTSLAWGARWPSLVAACLTLVAVYELARALGDAKLGLTSALICASSIFFMKFSRQASYDLHLFLWVTVTNVFFARMVFWAGNRWWACAGAGFALGLALMSKGPPALVETVWPMAIFVGWERFKGSSISSQGQPDLKRWLGPILLGTAICLLIALPWTVAAYWELRHSVILHRWYEEVSLRIEAKENRAGWHTYIVCIALMAPWSIWAVIGLIEGFTTGRLQNEEARKSRFLVVFLLMPMVILELMPARRDRYALPMLGPAAVLAALALIRALPAKTTLNRWLLRAQWATVIGMAVGFPLWAWLSPGLPANWLHVRIPRLVTDTGEVWLSPHVALTAAAIACVVSVIALARRNNTLARVVGFSVALAMVFQLTFLWGYRVGEGNVGEGPGAARAILDPYPDAEIYNADPSSRPILPHLIMIYLNRNVMLLPDPSELAPSGRPQVLIYPPLADLSTPRQVPAGFVHFAHRKLNEGIYQMYVRP